MVWSNFIMRHQNVCSKGLSPISLVPKYLHFVLLYMLTPQILLPFTSLYYI